MLTASGKWLRRSRTPRLCGTLRIRDAAGREFTVPLRGRATVVTGGGTGLIGYGEVWAVHVDPSTADTNLMISYGRDEVPTGRESGLCTAGQTVTLGGVHFTWHHPAADSGPHVDKSAPVNLSAPVDLGVSGNTGASGSSGPSGNTGASADARVPSNNGASVGPASGGSRANGGTSIPRPRAAAGGDGRDPGVDSRNALRNALRNTRLPLPRSSNTRDETVDGSGGFRGQLRNMVRWVGQTKRS